MKATHAHKLVEDGVFTPGRTTEKDLTIDAKNMVNGETSTIEKSTISLMRKATNDCAEAFKTFDEAYCGLVKRQCEVEKSVRKNVSGFKDKANEVSTALARINKVAGEGFELKITLLERFVSAVNQLDQLNDSGRLDKVIDIFNSINKGK